MSIGEVTGASGQWNVPPEDKTNWESFHKSVTAFKKDPNAMTAQNLLKATKKLEDDPGIHLPLQAALKAIDRDLTSLVGQYQEGGANPSTQSTIDSLETYFPNIGT